MTPVVQSRGSVGEGDLVTMSNIGATMVGSGEAYYQGVRMSAAQALVRAGLKPIEPEAADDDALTSTNAYAGAQTAFLVDDARQALKTENARSAVDMTTHLLALDLLNAAYWIDLRKRAKPLARLRLGAGGRVERLSQSDSVGCARGPRARWDRPPTSL